jgi:hypothetical protein
VNFVGKVGDLCRFNVWGELDGSGGTSKLRGKSEPYIILA